MEFLLCLMDEEKNVYVTVLCFNEQFLDQIELKYYSPFFPTQSFSLPYTHSRIYLLYNFRSQYFHHVWYNWISSRVCHFT